MLSGKRVLLIVTGGIAAFKAPALVRLLRAAGAQVRCVLSRGGARFTTALTLAAVSGDKVYEDLFSLTDENEMGHIELSRAADLLVVAPATAHTLAKMAQGLADDLTTTVVLATDKPILVAPAMNVRMWDHGATQANMATLRGRGIHVVGPEEGDMACGEYGLGRMAEPDAIRDAVIGLLGGDQPLRGKKALVTSGPTHEAIDPVRYIANRSSGRQGHAIAATLARLGADTLLVSGPSAEPDPAGVAVCHIESADDMLAACQAALPVDIAVCAAAVADWKVAAPAENKLKKGAAATAPGLEFIVNPDILATLSAAGARRPALVIGFAAETENVPENAVAKRQRKGCDWIVANDVSPQTGVFGGTSNTVYIIDATGTEAWPTLSKTEVADRLGHRIAAALGAAS